MNLLAAIVILISFDGLRPDQITPKTAPHIVALEQKGVSADYMEASFPASTFINHASLITGCTTEEHGIVSNNFLDPKRGEFRMEDDANWMECEPLWAAATKQGVTTAIYSWPMTQMPWHGIKPAYFLELPRDKKEKGKFFERFDNQKELKQIVDWLKLPEKKRPHLIIGYFPAVDSAGHKWGPFSKKTLKAVSRLDLVIANLLSETKKMGLERKINFVFVSDHGMAVGKNKIAIDLPRWPGVRYQASSGSLLNFYSNNPSSIQQIERFFKNYPALHVYKAAQFPERWHYKNRRSGDLIVTVDVPDYIVFKEGKFKKTIGFHGYDPASPDLHAFFAASGPAFQKKHLKKIQNTEVAPMIAEVLGVRFRQPSK